MKIERVATERLRLGEGAVWDRDGKALLFLDIYGEKVLRFDPATADTQTWRTPGHVGALALREGGGAVLAIKDALHALDFASGVLEKIAGPAFANPRVTVNDGTADRAGRFVFGGCSAGIEDPQPVGGLYLLDADRRITELDRGTYQSNSHCFSPDGRTLYAADSFVRTLYAYDYDPAAGAVANKRVFMVTTELAGVPDGSAVDADGLVWVSIFQAGKIAAYRPDGRLERVIDMPAKLISSVAWGGEGLDRLFVTTIDPAAFGWGAEEGGGYVYVVDGLGTRGLPEGRYAG
jgi:sugar lactone lactonase YvrE